MPPVTARSGLAFVLVGLLLAVLPGSAQTPLPAEISLRRLDGEALSSVELGSRFELEVVIDTGDDELTGFAFYLSFDSTVFRVVPPPGSNPRAEVTEPFAAGGWLDGIVLLNRIDEENGDVFLSYSEAAGVQRRSVTGTGVAATFALEAIRRPLGDVAELIVVEQGQKRTSHYTIVDAPGRELLFGKPLGSASLRVTGFQIGALPDVTVVEGDGEQLVFADLGSFVEQEGAQVIWSASFVEGLNTRIDADGRVTMHPDSLVGEAEVVFTAFEVGEGNEDADAVKVRILSRPRVVGLPPTITFDEDGSSPPVDLDDFVVDLDDPVDSLRWTPTNGTFVRVDIDPQTRRAVFSALPDSAGEGQIRIVVTDTHGLTDTVTTRVVVVPVNDAPTIQRRGPVYPTVGDAGAVAIPFAQLITDADDVADSLQVLLEAEGAVTASLSEDNQQIGFVGNAPGRGVVRMTVQDRAGEVATGRVVAVALPSGVTQAPEIAPLPQLRFVSGLLGTLDLKRFVRDDGPVGDLRWTTTAADELRPIVQDGVLLVTAETGFTGPASIGLTVRDGDGNRDEVRLRLFVLSGDEPQGPRIHPPPKIGLASADIPGGGPRQVLLRLDELVDDPDDADARIQWDVDASQGLSATFDAAARTVLLSATDGLNDVGALTLTATDDDGESDTRAIPVLVVEEGGAPLIARLADVVLDSAAAVGRLDLDDVVFDDEDFESELAWSAETEPGIAFDLDPVTHLLRVHRTELPGSEQPPSEARIVLTVTDTRNQTRSAILTVALPPVFQLQPIPDIVLFTGASDTSLVLSEQVVSGDPPRLRWTVAAPRELTVRIDSATTRVRVEAPGAFVGSEILRFTAVDASGRSRTANVRVRVRGRGLAPQIRTFPVVSVRAGEEDRTLDVDDFVVDDDADSTLLWSVSEPADVTVLIDELNHELTIRPDATAVGPRTAQLLVVDPAGNTALGFLEISVLRGGEAPVIGALPQVLLPAGGPEQVLSLDLFVEDADTPDDQIAWTASAEAGITARVEGRRLLVAVPPGQQGSRRVVLVATDPQGNRDEGALTVLIQQDDEPPAFAITAARNELVSDLIDIRIQASEALDGPVEVRLNGGAAEAVEGDDNQWQVTFQVPALDGDQLLTIDVSGRDRAGNAGERTASISLRRIGERGGSVASADGRVSMNVPGAVARPGRLAILYPLAEEDLPEGAADGDGPVYAVEIAAAATLDSPVTLNLFAGADAADPTRGIERWNPDAGQWEDVPAATDEDAGWLSAAVRTPGLYRIGPVTADNRRPATRLSNYPNPFNAGGGAATRIEYEVSSGGPVQLQVYNLLGQRVRVLVREPFQDVGLWTVDWDGRDDRGRQLASGVYFYQLTEGGSARVRQLLLLR